MNAVVFGGTRGIGRAVARLLVARGDRVCLLGRSQDDLDKSAADLAIRGGEAQSVGVAICDLARPETFGPALDAAAAALGSLDVIVVTAAEFGTQEALEADLDRARSLLVNNFSHTIIFCEEARRRLLPQGGTLAVVSSVAGERGRKPVIIYGAAKAGLTRYLEGLEHKYRAQGLRVVTVKPGFVKTAMTAGLKPPPFAGEAPAVARDIVRAIDRGLPVVYTPPIWRYVMLVIRLLPRAVMRKIGF